MTSNLHLQRTLQSCSPDMQAEIAYRLALQETRRRFWANLSYRVETVMTTATVVGTLAILMVPGINQATTEWYGDIEWLHASEQAASAEASAEPKAIAPDARIFPIPGQTHAIAVKEKTFTSGYGPRESPGGIGSSFHRGNDYAAPVGTPLLATESGTVETWTDGGCGNGMEIKAKERSIIYCHLHEFKVQNGQSVNAGDVVGTVGSTGNSTGPHLHIGVIEGDDYIDPSEYLKALPSGLEKATETSGTAKGEDLGAASPAAEEYFSEVCKPGGEFGTGQKYPAMPNAKIEILGNATDADRQALEQVVSELRALGASGIQIVPSGGDVRVHFADPGEFRKIEPNYVEGNLGFFWSSGNVLIAAGSRVTQRERDHLLREEITQLLTGCYRDSNRYPDSIFYQGWTDTTQYTELDKAVIKKAFEK